MTTLCCKTFCCWNLWHNICFRLTKLLIFFCSSHLDLHELWVPNQFAIHTFKIIMYSIQVCFHFFLRKRRRSIKPFHGGNRESNYSRSVFIKRLFLVSSRSILTPLSKLWWHIWTTTPSRTRRSERASPTFYPKLLPSLRLRAWVGIFSTLRRFWIWRTIEIKNRISNTVKSRDMVRLAVSSAQ